MKATATALTAALLLAIASPVAAHDPSGARARYHGDLVDLDPNDGLDAAAIHAHARYRSSERKGTRLRLRLSSMPKVHAGQTWNVHLHDGDCDSIGGHYQNLVGGTVDAVNEAWPTIVQSQRRTRSTHRSGRSANDWEVRPDQAVVIGIHHPDSGALAACVPLTVRR